LAHYFLETTEEIMSFISNIFKVRSPLQERIDWVLAPRPTSREVVERGTRRNHLYFSIRPFAPDGLGEVLQYAFVDECGNVVMSAIARAQRPGAACPGSASAVDLPVDPVDPQTLDFLLTHLCGGATLVGFGRVLQAGLLPLGVAESAASVQCAWRRFVRLARRRGLRPEWSQPLTLGDAMAFAGLAPMESEDAALCALAIRDLWAWMDRME
jgi:hypothetical protein